MFKGQFFPGTRMTFTHERKDTCRMCGEREAADTEPYCDWCGNPRQTQAIVA